MWRSSCAIVKSFPVDLALEAISESPGCVWQNWYNINWSTYTLVNCYITMEHHRFSWVNQLFPWPSSIAFCMFTMFTREYRSYSTAHHSAPQTFSEFAQLFEDLGELFIVTCLTELHLLSHARLVLFRRRDDFSPGHCKKKMMYLRHEWIISYDELDMCRLPQNISCDRHIVTICIMIKNQQKQQQQGVQGQTKSPVMLEHMIWAQHLRSGRTANHSQCR